MGVIREVIWTTGLTATAFMVMRQLAFNALVGIDTLGYEFEGDPKLVAEYSDLGEQRKELGLTRTLSDTEITANMSQAQIEAIKEAQASLKADTEAYYKAYDSFNQLVLGRTPFEFSNPLGWGVAAALGIATRTAYKGTIGRYD